MSGAETSPEAVDEYLERQQIAVDFKSIVERAVAPVLNGIARPIYFLPTITRAQETVRIGGTSIYYTLYNPAGNDGIEGVQGLDFVPEHLVEFSGASFGLNRNNALLRAIPKYGLLRELETNEAKAAVQYATAPHLFGEQRTIALQKTPEEQERIEELNVAWAKSRAEFQETLKKIKEAERRAWEKVHSIFIR